MENPVSADLVFGEIVGLESCPSRPAPATLDTKVGVDRLFAEVLNFVFDRNPKPIRQTDFYFLGEMIVHRTFIEHVLINKPAYNFRRKHIGVGQVEKRLRESAGRPIGTWQFIALTTIVGSIAVVRIVDWLETMPRGLAEVEDEVVLVDAVALTNCFAGNDGVLPRIVGIRDRPAKIEAKQTPKNGVFWCRQKQSREGFL